MDDEALREGFERLVRISGTPAPSRAELDGRVVVRARRRRARQRAAFGACAAAVVLLGLLAITFRSPADGSLDRDRTTLTSKPKPTAVPVDTQAEPVFTIARVPEGLAFRSCDSLSDGADPTTVTGATCTFDEPSTAAADGLRITRLLAVAGDALTAAWAADDAPASAAASGGSDAPASARFTTLAGTKVLDLTVAGQPSDDRSAALRLIVGDHLVDIGATGVTLADLGHVVTGMSMEPPSVVVSEALDALPDGSVAVVQGERPLWVQANPLEPDQRARFGGDTVGTEIGVPGSTDLVGIDVTTGIDADTFLDDLLGNGAAFRETEISGHRAVVLALGGMMPVTVPEPRPGPQVVVRLDDDVIVRVKNPDGDPALVQAIAEAIS